MVARDPRELPTTGERNKIESSVDRSVFKSGTLVCKLVDDFYVRKANKFCLSNIKAVLRCTNINAVHWPSPWNFSVRLCRK